MENISIFIWKLESIPFIFTVSKFSQNISKYMIVITDKAINAIRSSNRLIGRLMGEFNRGQNTLENWMASKDIRLTTPGAVNIISEETGLADTEILEDVTEEVTQS